MAIDGFIKTPWNKYEVALLIDAYLKHQSGEVSKAQATTLLSNRLRAHLQNMGVSISETYRNESGISLQMSAIEYLLTDGESGINHVGSLFREIVELYKENRDEFNALLEAANSRYEMTEVHDGTSVAVDGYGIQGKRLNPVLNDVTQPKYVSRKLKDILANRFPRGYKLGSYMEVARLKKFYLEEYEEELDMDGEDIDEDIKTCGIEYEGRVYLPELMLSASLKDDLLSYIAEYFNKGGNCLFYSVLFHKFSVRFLDSHILNERMLRQYLEYINKGKWFFSDLYFSCEWGATVSVLNEVVSFVKDQGGVVSKDEVVIGLSYLPEQQIRDAFDERDTNLVSCGRNQRFHLDNFVISKEELSSIEKIIRKAIASYKFIAFSELMKDMSVNVPSILENNKIFTEIGIRNALALKLGSKFNFYNSVISDFGHLIKPEDAFLEMAKRPHYSIDDVKSLADAFGSLPNMYLEPMLKYSVRVDKENFVSKNQVHFDVNAVDDVLLRLCEGDYIALNDVTMLSTLPSCEFKWTPFLLECYVAFYSKLFKLVHNKYFGQAYTTGGIVKRSSHINDFNTLAATAVVDAGIPIEKKAVLQFLSEKSYTVQRRYEDIDEVLSLANRIMHDNNSK